MSRANCSAHPSVSCCPFVRELLGACDHSHSSWKGQEAKGQEQPLEIGQHSDRASLMGLASGEHAGHPARADCLPSWLWAGEGEGAGLVIECGFTYAVPGRPDHWTRGPPTTQPSPDLPLPSSRLGTLAQVPLPALPPPAHHRPMVFLSHPPQPGPVSLTLSFRPPSLLQCSLRTLLLAVFFVVTRWGQFPPTPPSPSPQQFELDSTFGLRQLETPVPPL